MSAIACLKLLASHPSANIVDLCHGLRIHSPKLMLASERWLGKSILVELSHAHKHVLMQVPMRPVAIWSLARIKG